MKIPCTANNNFFFIVRSFVAFAWISSPTIIINDSISNIHNTKAEKRIKHSKHNWQTNKSQSNKKKWKKNKTNCSQSGCFLITDYYQSSIAVFCSSKQPQFFQHFFFRFSIWIRKSRIFQAKLKTAFNGKWTVSDNIHRNDIN